MTWRCYLCGETYCGYCIFRHGPLVGAVALAEVEDGRVDPGELVEGMHALLWRLYQRLASEMASDPASCAMHALRLDLNAPCLSTNDHPLAFHVSFDFCVLVASLFELCIIA